MWPMVFHQARPNIRVASSPVMSRWRFWKLVRSNQYTLIASEPQRAYWLEGGVGTTRMRREALEVPPELLTSSLTVFQPKELKLGR